jgi:ubiquinone/menaquinone biosynthesis C-methylase UbiE
MSNQAQAAGTQMADPGAVWRVINGCSAYFVAVAGVRLGVFDALASGPLDAPTLAARCGAPATRVQMLCDALVGIGLLGRDGAAYVNTPESDTFLVGERPRSMRDLLLHSPGPFENWPALAGTVRGESPPQVVGGDFYRDLVRATFPTQYAAACALRDDLGTVTRVLDLGAGAAPWAIALLETNPDAGAVLNDLPAVIDITRESAAAHGCADRCSFVAGDYFDVELDDAAFDVVVLGHVLRAEGADGARRLLRRALGALRPGGTVVVADYFLDDDRQGPVNALLLGATMMAATPDGATFTRTAYRGWLADAGATSVEARQPVPFQEVLLARKPG